MPKIRPKSAKWRVKLLNSGYGYRWEVSPRFNVGVEGARTGGFGGLAGADGRGSGPAHSVQVRGQIGF